MDENAELKEQRELNRVNEIMQLAFNQDGVVSSREIADKWGIPPERVQKYLEYLLLKHNVPIKRVERGYPTFIFDLKEDFQFHDVDEVDMEKDIRDYTYPGEIKRKRKQIKTCPTCGTKVESSRFCGNCGSDLRALK